MHHLHVQIGKAVVTGHNRLRSILVNGIPRHIRDVSPVNGWTMTVSPPEREITLECEDSESSESGLVVECKDSTQTSRDTTGDDDQSDADEESSPV